MLRKLFKKENQAKQVVLVFGFVILSLLVLNLVVYFLWLGERPLSIGVNITSDKKAVIKDNLLVETDKSEYEIGEMIKITFKNLDGNQFSEADKRVAPVVETNRYLGRNYGVGLIEKQDYNGSWYAVEPVWRCDNECYRDCNMSRSLNPAEERTFYWPQTVVICHGLTKEEEVRGVYPGRYRVSSAIYNEAEKRNRFIRSNEFVIK